MPFLFTALPPEIRNRIYALALLIPGEICPTAAGIHNRWQHTDASAPKNLSINAALLRTNHQLHAEAAPVLYAHTHFAFIDGPTPSFPTAWDLVGMYAFFVTVGRRNRLLIRHLTVRIAKPSHAAYHAYQRNARELGEALGLLGQGHGLRVLRIVFAEREGGGLRGGAYFNFFAAGKRVVEKLEGVKGVGELEISGDVGEGTGVDGLTHGERVDLLREVMEVGRGRGEEGGSDALGDECGGVAGVGGRRISERLRLLERERDELKAQLAVLEGRVEGMQTWSVALAGVEELRRRVDDLASLI